jgi:hypothetical protein
MNKIIIDIINNDTKESKRYILLNTINEEVIDIVLEQCEILGWKNIKYDIIDTTKGGK